MTTSTHSSLLYLCNRTVLSITLLACVSAHATQICRVSGVAADDTLNIRNGIGMSSSVIGTFAANEDGLEQFNCQYNGNTEWCLVSDQARQRTGWVASHYLDCREAGDAQPVATSTPPALAAPRAPPNPTAIGSWCQATPYCSVSFEGQTYYFPTGWKVTAPYHDTYSVGRYRTKAATVVSTRQSDGTKAYLNVVQLKRRDCNDQRYPLGSLCFEPSLQPVTARERHIFGGLPNADIADEHSHPAPLSNAVTVIIKAVGNQEPVREWQLLSDAALDEFFKDFGEDLPEAPPEYPYVVMRPDTDGTIRFDTRFSGPVYVQGLDGADEPHTTQKSDIVIEAQPATQCFLIPPQEEGSDEQARQAMLLRYKLPYHYSSEGHNYGFNNGTQPPVGSNDDGYGHGPDLTFRLASIPCERLTSGTGKIPPMPARQ
ncbi:SH3 domain-containing protein [Cardiobacteriaceae bacterium TAE3-ERU3]|nr:SH3 domain-containing protein [Cardiobacteriaceae bacterium TAE3-ERU3]